MSREEAGMIKDARLGKEIVVTVVNKIGVLADMSRLIAEHGINIEGVAGYAVDNEARLMLITEDSVRATDALKKSGYKSIKENEVIIIELENKPGALERVTAKLAVEGIDIKQVYGTACASDCPANIIISTDNNQKALLALKE